MVKRKAAEQPGEKRKSAASAEQPGDKRKRARASQPESDKQAGTPQPQNSEC